MHVGATSLLDTPTLLGDLYDEAAAADAAAAGEPPPSVQLVLHAMVADALPADELKDGRASVTITSTEQLEVTLIAETADGEVVADQASWDALWARLAAASGFIGSGTIGSG